MPRTTRSVLATTAVIATMMPTALLAVPPHTSEGQCADFVVEQYNKDGDEDGLKFGLQDCNDAYATEEGEEQKGAIEFWGNPQEIGISKPVKRGTLVLLPPYGDQVPQSLSESSSSSDEPRRR